MDFLLSIPLTKYKMFLAKLVYQLLDFFPFEKNRIIRRSGINYEVDLAEAIDLMLFVLGGFQKNIINNEIIKIKEDAVIFDIGANVGYMTLNYAKRLKTGTVYAFEPTHFAHNKLLKNISLNPLLNERIKVFHTFVSNSNEENMSSDIYSSWRLDDNSNNRHPIHLGVKKSAYNISAIRVDDFCQLHKIERLDVIKIDTDGHESQIFQGARESIDKMRPYIIFEIGLYLLDQYQVNFSFYTDYFHSINYTLIERRNRKRITLENYKLHIPQNSTIDIIAIPG